MGAMQLFLRSLLTDRIMRSRLPTEKSKDPAHVAEARARRNLMRLVVEYMNDELKEELGVIHPGVNISNAEEGKLRALCFSSILNFENCPLPHVPCSLLLALALAPCPCPLPLSLVPCSLTVGLD